MPSFSSNPSSQSGDPAIDQLRMPPHSIQAEQAVLGGLMIGENAWDQVADRVGGPDFYRHEHRLIFEAIGALAEKDKPYDVVTLAEELERKEQLEDASGLPYLASLAADTPTAANIRAYADIVREHAMVRELIRVSTEIVEKSYRREGREVDELIDEAEQRVFDIRELRERQGEGFQPIKQVMREVVDRIEVMHAEGAEHTGIPSGYLDLDKMTSGLQRGDLIIVAGRPSMGKTTFAMNIAEFVAISQHLPVAVFSMEMPADALVMRLLSSLGRIDQQRLRKAELEDEEWAGLTSGINLLSDAQMFIDDTPGLTPVELRARARRLKREVKELGLIVVDYLQLMQSAVPGENRATEISNISRALKGLAKELKVPVMALSQLNRSLEQRQDKRPMMADLRESGAIEQDADVILFVFREEVYDKENPDLKGKAEIVIGKQRNGPTGVVHLLFRGQFTRFENYATESYGDDYA